MRAHPRSKAAGYTLIEVMVVVAILLILAAIAYPGYSGYVIKARRAEAQAVLLELMQKQEQHYTRHNTYIAFSSEMDAASAPGARHFRWWSGSHPAASGYELRGEACADEPIERCIVIKAMPGTAQVDAHFRDPACGTLALYSTGARASGGPLRACWP